MCFKKRKKKVQVEELVAEQTQTTEALTLEDVKKGFDQDAAAVNQRSKERIDQLKEDAANLRQEEIEARAAEIVEATDRDCDKLLIDFAKRLIDLNKSQKKDSKK